MREFIVRVNGEEFQVEVEEVRKGQKPAPVSRSPEVSVAKLEKPKSVPASPATPAENNVIAPMPGTILAIKFKVGDQIEAGAEVIILEAMKLENLLTAPVSGTIKAIKTSVGASVNAGDTLIEIG